MDELENLLLETIDEILRYCLGDLNTQLVYNYLEKKGCPKQDIPQRIDIFAAELENLIGTGKGQILGAARIIEDAILKTLSTKLEINYDGTDSVHFPAQIKKIKDKYYCMKGTASKLEV